jgi:GNAT superfamily N-acetyltransferase
VAGLISGLPLLTAVVSSVGFHRAVLFFERVLPMPDEVMFRPVTAESWADFARLFESRGAPKSCWCTVWRIVHASPASRRSAATRKQEMKQRISAAEPVGLLGYIGAEPVAWCSVAPRNTYRSSVSDTHSGDGSHRIWSIVCFFVTRDFRGQGMFRKLLAAAEEHAANKGATLLEAYPVDPDSPSYRFGGFLPAFQEAGFALVGQKGTRRHIVRKVLRAD